MTDDESGLSQLRQQIESLISQEHRANEESVPFLIAPMKARRMKIVAYKEVLKLVEAASEKYRQSRKSLLKGVLELLQDRTDNLALDPDEYPSLKGDIEAIFARAEEAKPVDRNESK